MLCCFFLLPTATCCVSWYFSGAKSFSSCNAVAKRQKSNKGVGREGETERKGKETKICFSFPCATVCRIYLLPFSLPALSLVSSLFLLLSLPIPPSPFLYLSISWLLTAASCPHINIWFDCLSVLRVSVTLCVCVCLSVALCVFQVCCQLLLLSLFRISFVLRGRHGF